MVGVDLRGLDCFIFYMRPPFLRVRPWGSVSWNLICMKGRILWTACFCMIIWMLQMMLNSNLMYLNEQYDMPSELHDSVEEVNYQPENPSIKAINLYQLNQSLSEDEVSGRRELEIDHELDESSIENDDFLEMVKREEKMLDRSSYDSKSVGKHSSELLLVDRTNINLTLLESQSARQTVAFTNPTANPIKMCFSECPFQIQNEKMLGFVLAGQLEVIIQPWGRVELIFAIEKPEQSYGDLIETVVVKGQFTNRNDLISSVSIQFHVKFISPTLTMKYEGGSDIVHLVNGKIAVASLKPNKMGEYQLDVVLGDSVPKIEMSIQTRGKVTVSTQSVTFYSGEPTRLKLRYRGQKGSNNRERGGILLKPVNTSICYVLGVQFIDD